jgi:ATP-dependent Lhr-like helicase
VDLCGRAHQPTLKYALEWKGRWKVVPDNFALKIEGDGVSHDAVVEQLQAMRAPNFWKATETRQKILSQVPEYRLSKFQRVLPDALQVEMVGEYLVDFGGAEAFLNRLK